MKTNQWFKLAVLSFVGILISSVSLSIMNPASSAQQNTGMAATQQNTSSDSQHNAHVAGQVAGNGTANTNGTGNNEQMGQMGQDNQGNQMGQNNQYNPLSQEQIAEIQLKIWNLQARLDAMRAMSAPNYGMNYGYGNAYGYGNSNGYGVAPGPQFGPYGAGMQPGFNNMANNSMNNMNNINSNSMNNMNSNSSMGTSGGSNTSSGSANSNGSDKGMPMM